MIYDKQIPFVDLSRKIARHRKLIDGAIERVLSSGRFVLDSECSKFERLFSEYIGVNHCVGVASGTDAIELALRACGISANMKVATSANAGNYATSAIQAIGAEPIFMDVSFATRNIALPNVEGAIRQGARAVVATHLYGLAIEDIEEIKSLCNAKGIILIEDCAQAHGAMVNKRKVGSFGDASAFSFYPTKNLGALGEAGAVLTDNTAIAKSVQQLRTYGWSEKYSVEIEGGRNSRIDEIQAAILTDLLPFLDSDNSRRREIAKMYRDGLHTDSIALPPDVDTEYVAHLFVVTSEHRELVIEKLARHGISTAIHFPIPDHLQFYRNEETEIALEVTEKLSDQIISLPCYPELLNEEVTRIIQVLNSI